MSFYVATAAVITVLFVTAYRAPVIPWLRAAGFGWPLTGDDGCLSAHLDRDLDPITHTGITVVFASPINTKNVYQVTVTTA